LDLVLVAKIHILLRNKQTAYEGIINVRLEKNQGYDRTTRLSGSVITPPPWRMATTLPRRSGETDDQSLSWVHFWLSTVPLLLTPGWF